MLCAGVSNFDVAELAELLKFAEIKPAVVQRNSDPFSQDVEMLAYCRFSGIQYQVRWGCTLHTLQPAGIDAKTHRGHSEWKLASEKQFHVAVRRRTAAWGLSG